MKNIFVGNLGYEITEQDIQALFEKYGEVQRVKLITDRDTGRSRGFAFVEMGNDGEAQEAITGLNGSQLAGRGLNVNEARPRGDGGTGGARGSGEKGAGGPSRRQPQR